MVEGADECGATPLVFLDAIDTDHALTLVPGTPHDVFSTDAGTAAARTALREACGF
jgi:hypothetical protein